MSLIQKQDPELWQAMELEAARQRDKLELIAQALMERETLEASELEELVTTGHITEKPQPEDDEPEHDDDTVIVEKLKQTIEQRDAEPDTATAVEPEKAEEKETAPKLNVTRHE